MVVVSSTLLSPDTSSFPFFDGNSVACNYCKCLFTLLLFIVDLVLFIFYPSMQYIMSLILVKYASRFFSNIFILLTPFKQKHVIHEYV